MIIALSGYARSGKNAVAEIIKMKQPHRNWQIKGFSHKLKEVASVLTSIETSRFEDQAFKRNFLPSWSMTVREFLQRLGTEAIRNGLHKDAWVNALLSEYKAGDNWIIVDCRFPNEARGVDILGGRIVRVVRPGVDPVNPHESETALDDYKFDYILTNDGSLEELSRSVDQFLLNI